jgi:hypothetical protein
MEVAKAQIEAAAPRKKRGDIKATFFSETPVNNYQTTKVSGHRKLRY